MFFLTTPGLAQDLKLPKQPYVLKIGEYKFVSETVIEQSPNFSDGFSSANFGGLQLEMAAKDKKDRKPVYLNGDSLRLWTYLFKNDTVAIRFPQRIDTTEVYDILTSETHIRYDTTDRMVVNRIVDTISAEQLKKLLTTEIEIYNGARKLELRRISVKLLWGNGDTYYMNYEQKRIGDYKGMTERALRLSPGGYLILDVFWYYNLEHDQSSMEGSIAWKIK